jgi:hypothetical protein
MTHRVQRIATYVGYMSAAMMVTMGGMIWLLTSDWCVLTLAKADPGVMRMPVALVSAGPQLVLVFGFLTIVSALCGAFRSQKGY